MEICRKEQFMSFKLHAILSRVMKSRTAFLCPAQKVSHTFSSVQFSSVAQSCPTLCEPMNRSMPGLSVHH